MRKAVLPLLLVLGLSAAFVGCGGGGGGDEDKVRDVVKKVASNDPEVCEDVSDEFLSRQFGGDKAKCEKAAKDGKENQDVKIEKVEINGDKATVRAVVDKDPGVARLVKEDGDWKLDALTRPGQSATEQPRSRDEVAARGAVDAFLIAVRKEDANVFCGLLTERFARKLFDVKRFGIAKCANQLAKSFDWSRLQKRFRGGKIKSSATFGTGAGITLNNGIQFGLKKLKGRWQINSVAY